MKRLRAYHRLVLVIVLGAWGLTCTGLAFSATNPGQEDSALREFQLSPAEYPNPHSPFWASEIELGFVTAEGGEAGTRGAVFLCDLRSRAVRRLLNELVYYPTVIQTRNRLSYVAAVRNRGLALFTMSLSDKRRQEHDLDGLGIFGPSWSPDGRQVVAADLSYDSDLFIADVQTTRVRSLGSLGRGKETSGVEAPDWSPNGRTIVYVGWDKSSRSSNGCCYNPTYSRLYLYDLASGVYRPLTGGPFQDRYPAYSPDGEQIVFRSNRSGNAELWLITSQGKQLRRITDMASHGLQVAWDKPSWSPDQSKIAFTVVPASRRLDKGGFLFEGSQIWILDLGRTR